MALYDHDLKEPFAFHECLKCGIRYQGLYCPYCGTKAGHRRLSKKTREILIFYLGMFVGCLLLILVTILIWNMTKGSV